MPDISHELLKLCTSVTAKRPKTVIDHLLQHDHITTEELKEIYGYDHPPRAIRDVREQGIPLETFRVTGKNGRDIAAYRFGNLETPRIKKLSGRTALSRKLKQQLINQHGNRCFIYLEEINEQELQIDHRIPFEIAGDVSHSSELNPNDFMLLSASANRAKSWSCEHCDNWTGSKDSSVCTSCYWAYPENYSHIAMQEVRRLDILWQGKDVNDYERLKKRANNTNKALPIFVKEVLKKIR